MKKQLLFISALCLVASSGFAQLDSIPNANFDYWTSGEPNGWGTSNGLSLGGTSLSGTVTKATGADILSVNTIIVSSKNFSCGGGGGSCIVPGMAISNGTVGPGTGGNPVAFAGGFPYSEHAIALTGMYKYICVGDPTNEFNVPGGANIQVVLTKWNGTSRDTLALGRVLLATNTSYAAFSLPITYSITAVAPDTAQILLLSSGHYVPAQLFIDNLAFDNLTGISSPVELENEITIFPNPASAQLNITLQEIIANTSLTIVNVLGEEVYGQIITSKTTTINIENFAKGMYTLIIQNNDNKAFKKIVVN